MMDLLGQNARKQSQKTIAASVDKVVAQNIEKLQDVMAAFTDSIFQLFELETGKVEDEEARKAIEEYAERSIYQPYRLQSEEGRLRRHKTLEKIKQDFEEQGPS